GHRDGPGPQGGDRGRPDQAGHAGDGPGHPGPALRGDRRADPDRHPDRRVPQPGQVVIPDTERTVASILNSDVRKGKVLIWEDGQLYAVIDRDLRTPGNLPSKLTFTIKSLKTGFVRKERVHPSDKVEVAYLERRPMQYLYQDGDGYVFMDQESYDQITLGKEWVGDLILYLKENDVCQVTFHDSKPLNIEPPVTVELKVTETEPSVKGATAAAQYKPATLE